MKATLGWLAVSLAVTSSVSAAKLHPETLEAWEEYTRLTEARVQREIDSGDGFLVRDFLDERQQAAIRSALAAGDTYVDRMRTPNEEGGELKIPKGLVHHWYGIVFLPSEKLEDVLARVQDYDNHQNEFEKVEESRLVSRQGDVFDVFLRLYHKKVIRVHYNTTHQVAYRRIGDHAASSRSESTRIAELDEPGSAREREKPVGNDRGFLWRLNSYWRFQQSPEGVYVECESMSLSRSFPLPLRWFVVPLIDSVPRESLESALRPLREAAVEVAADGGS